MHKIRSFPPPSSRASTRLLASTLALAAAGCAALAPSASAISMRDDVANANSTGNDNPYVASGASTAFDPIGSLQFTTQNANGTSSTGFGTGMLVSTSTPGVYKFLTAAHNVDNYNAAGTKTPDGKADNSSYDLYFGARISTDDSTAAAHVMVAAASVSIMPLWVSGKGTLTASSSQYDMAVITFNLGMVVNGTLPAARLGFSLASPLGKTGTIVGYGSYGLGNNFANLGPDGVRRAGNNTIDFVASATNPANTGYTLQTDFDSPRDATKSTLGSTTPLTLEATTAGGDSGGPLLVQNANGVYQIVGVLNGGYPGTGGNLSEYGDRSIWASVTDADNYAYLLGQGVAVPEPSTYAALVLGAVVLGGYGFRRRRVETAG